MVDREVRVRKSLLKIYNKREEDFATLREYNDYLETIEDMVFRLVNNDDKDEVDRMIERYRQDNADLIKHNHQRELVETRHLSELQELEKREQMQLDREDLEEIRTEQQDKVKQEDAFMQELAAKSSSDLASTTVANVIKSSDARKRPSSQKRTAATENKTADFTKSLMDRIHDSAKQSAGSGVTLAPSLSAIRAEEERLQKEMQQPFDPMETCHFDHPDASDVELFYDPALAAMHADTHGPVRAGGFMPQIAYLRAWDFASQGLFTPPAIH